MMMTTMRATTTRDDDDEDDDRHLDVIIRTADARATARVERDGRDKPPMQRLKLNATVRWRRTSWRKRR